jgi:hypothetical protein
MQTIKTKRTYKERDPKTGKDFDLELGYTINIEDGVVKEVINQSGYPCNTNSEVFEYYSQIYNN